MSGARVRSPVVAVVDWPAAATLKDNAGLLRRAGLDGGSRPRRGSLPRGQRSLVVRADGSGELQRFTAPTAARRLAAAVEDIHTRKAGKDRRG